MCAPAERRAKERVQLVVAACGAPRLASGTYMVVFIVRSNLYLVNGARQCLTSPHVLHEDVTVGVEEGLALRSDVVSAHKHSRIAQISPCVDVRKPEPGM